MAKIMLVEDDNNLREIYEARLIAEGYEIVSAKDGEEALALAVKEKPDLIISDVMMPKISGFDMLDILRTTPETKNTKIIMMTALSQAEDKTRAAKLGADRYLVKSQVTLEDVATVAREVLTGETPATTPTPTEPETTTPPAPEPSSVPVTQTNNSTAPSVEDEAKSIEDQINSFVAQNNIPTEPATTTPPAPEPTPVAEPVAATPVAEPTTTAPAPEPQNTPTDSTEPPTAPIPDTSQASTTTTGEASEQDNSDDFSPHLNMDTPSAPKKVINPINNINEKPNVNDLLEKEQLAAESSVTSFETVGVSSTPEDDLVLPPKNATPAAETPPVSQSVNSINISDDGTIVMESPTGTATTTPDATPAAETPPTTPIITPVATPPPLQGEEPKEPAPTNIPQPPSENKPVDQDPNSPNNIAL